MLLDICVTGSDCRLAKYNGRHPSASQACRLVSSHGAGPLNLGAFGGRLLLLLLLETDHVCRNEGALHERWLVHVVKGIRLQVGNGLIVFVLWLLAGLASCSRSQAGSEVCSAGCWTLV